MRIQDNYADAGSFDGFRFEKIREKEGESSKHSLVSLDLDYILFGHGRHAWYINFSDSQVLALADYRAISARDGFLQQTS